MATNAVNSTASATHALQIRPKNPAEQMQPARPVEEDAKANQVQQQANKTQQPEQSAPVVNDQGQTTGRIVNLTA